ncbi:hypothetical protein E2C01_068935 [Portunus trituberculatus]|uniref:Uncharacterized protein n=1 Tax=Portunus trituberculatus TaxID=210409 RepID=A0A5B7HTB4_PORTR|nr:hypothetical protein [Portunus trituberculatus]
MSVILDMFMQDNEEEEEKWMEEQAGFMCEEVEVVGEERQRHQEAEGDGTGIISSRETPLPFNPWESAPSSPLPVFSSLLQGSTCCCCCY